MEGAKKMSICKYQTLSKTLFVQEWFLYRNIISLFSLYSGYLVDNFGVMKVDMQWFQYPKAVVKNEIICGLNKCCGVLLSLYYLWKNDHYSKLSPSDLSLANHVFRSYWLLFSQSDHMVCVPYTLSSFCVNLPVCLQPGHYFTVNKWV